MDTKKLRQKILDLAIRGKLVPQDPNDEPASLLLERIRAEKERLIAEGKIKRPTKSKVSSSESHYQKFEPPFLIPDSWEWATVRDVSSSILYGVSESAKPNGKYKLLRITDIQDNDVIWNNVPFTNFDTNKAELYILQNGDILFARTGATVGKSYLVKDVPLNSIYASYLIRIRTSDEICPKYLKLFFESGYYWQQISEGSVGIGQPNVNGTSLGQLLIPIPPKTEQIRIIEEVDSLTKLIHSLDIWAVNLSNTIERTKKKILDLAMEGKLVPQDPTDEPAADMLLRINPKAKIITDNPHSWNIPNGWCWIKVSDVFTPLKRQLPTGEKFWYIDIDSVDNKQNIAYPKNIPIANAPSRASRYTQKGDVLFSMVRPYLRNIALVPQKDCIASTGFYVLHPSGAIDSMFSYLLALSTFFVDGLNSYMKGDNSPSIKKDNIENFVIPLPPLAEQTRIAAKVKELYSMFDEIEASLQS